MKFKINGNKIACIRDFEDPNENQAHSKTVATFDAHLDGIAPHVAAELSPNELRQLERWLEDRHRDRTKTAGTLVLESLPALLERAGLELERRGGIDTALEERLGAAMTRFSTALEAVDADKNAEARGLNEMDASTALKHRLGVLRDLVD